MLVRRSGWHWVTGDADADALPGGGPGSSGARADLESGGVGCQSPPRDRSEVQAPCTVQEGGLGPPDLSCTWRGWEWVVPVINL